MSDRKAVWVPNVVQEKLKQISNKRKEEGHEVSSHTDIIKELINKAHRRECK